MDALSLGKAFFSLGLDVGGLTQGITEAVSDVSNFAYKTTGAFGGIAKASKAVDDAVFKTVKTSERYTRWFRDASPEIRRANEWLYTYRQQQERIEKAMAVTQERIKSQIAAQKSLTQSIKLQEAVINERVAKEKQLELAYNRTVEAQKRLIAGGKATSSELQAMDSRVSVAKSVWESHSQALVVSRQRLETLKQSETTQASQLEVLKQRLIGLREEQHRINNSYALQKDTIVSLKEREKARNIELERGSKSARTFYDENGRIIPQNARFLGSINPVIFSIQKFQTITNNAVGGVTRLTKSISGIGVVAIGTLLANVTQGVALNTQSIVQYGIDAYKSYEMLGMSLTALSAREAVASGAFKDLASAQDWAKNKSKDLIDWMQKLAIQSPFSVDDISGAFRLGNALGFTASETQNLIQKTVDWAAATGATGQQIESTVRALGQMHNTGHVTLEDLNQLTDAGIAARDMLRQEFAPEIKKSNKSLEELISDGVLPADRAINAISRTMGKEFAGGAEKAGNSMTGLLNSIGDLENTALRQFFTRTFEVVQPMIANIVSFLQDEGTIASITNFGNMLGDSIGGALNWLGNVAFPAVFSVVQQFGPMLMDGFAYLTAIAQEAYSWGYNIGEQFSDGLTATIDSILSIVSWIGDTISYWLEPHSPPKILPDIDQWGTRTMQVYLDAFKKASPKDSIDSLAKSIQNGLDGSVTTTMGMLGQESISAYFAGWNDADFQVFDDIKQKVGDALQGLADAGQIDQKAVIPAMLGSGDAIKRALDEIRAVGSVSNTTFAEIQNVIGPTGGVVNQYVQSLLHAEEANKALSDAQRELNDITKKYDEQLDPLKKKLESLNASTSDKDRDKEIARLESMKKAYASNGMQRNADKIQAEIERLQTEKQIDQIERKKAAEEEAAAKKVSEKEEAAKLAAAELDFQEQMIAQQKEQNELIKKQIELLTEKSSSGKEGDDSEKLKKKEEAERKKAEAEEKRRAKAEYEARVAAADSEEEKLRLMQEEQSKYAEGTKEYLDMQKKIEVQKDRVTKAAEKAEQAEVDHALAMANEGDKIKILEERLAQLDPQSAEYAKRQEQLQRATEAQTKAQEKLSDAEFESKLAGKEKVEQIAMLKERLGGLTEGSLEYEKTLKRINTLQYQVDNAGGGRKKKDKVAGSGGAGKGILDDLKQDLNETKDKITDVGNKFTGIFDNVNKKVQEFKDKFHSAGVFVTTFGGNIDKLKPIIGAIVGALSVLVAHAVWVHIGMWTQRIVPFIRVFGGIISPMNIIIGLAALLGYAWASNFGGIQEIVFGVWGKIQPIFATITETISGIISAFQDDGISGGFNKIIESIPTLSSAIVGIATSIGQGIIDFFNSSDVQSILHWISESIDTAKKWLLSDGIPLFTRSFWSIIGSISTVLSSVGGFIQDKVREYIPIFINWVIKMAPVFIEKLGIWAGQLIGFLGDQINPIANKIGEIIGSIVQWFRDHGSEMAEKGVNGLIDFIIFIGGWLLSTGIPWLIGEILTIAQSLVPIIGKIVSGIGETLPLLLSELTQLIGIVITRLGGWLLSVGIPRLFQLVLDLGLGLINVILSLIREIFYRLPGIILSVGAGLGRIIIQVIGIVASLLTTFIVNIPNYLVQIIVAIFKFGNTLLSAFGTIIVGIGSVIGSIFTFIGGLVVGGIYQLMQYGRMIVEGFSSGFSEGFSQFMQFFADIWNSIVVWIKDFFGIHSPSTVFADIGRFLIQGLIDGVSIITQFVDILINAFLQLEDKIIVGISTFVVKFIDFMINLASVVTTKIVNFLAGLLSLFGVSRDDVLSVVDKLRTGVIEKWDELKTKVLEIAGNIKTFISDTWNGIRDTAVSLWSSGPEGIIGKVMAKVGELRDKFKEFFLDEGEGSIQGIVQSAWRRMADGITELWQGIIDKLGDAFDDTAKAIKDGVNLLIGMANSAIDAANMVPGVSIPKIAKLYKGTMFAEGGTTLVGENGPELVNLPRGSEVLTNSRTMDTFERAAAAMADRMAAMTSNVMASLDRAAQGALRAMDSASNQTRQVETQQPVVQQTNTVTNERHDHWNLTVNTRATDSTVQTDFKTMMAIAGA